MSDTAARLELVDVSRSYPTGDHGSTSVLDGVTMTIEPGESVAIVGPSGSGKSTLLQLIGGLDVPTSGAVRLDDTDIASLGATELAAIRNTRIGFVFQSHHLLPQCTALENVLIPTLVAGKAAAADATERATALLDRVGLGDRLTHRPGQLSGGECQRVAVVRALINGPGLLLADEPTGSLDQHAAESLVELLVELNAERGVTLVVVTHSMTLAARMGRVLELRKGRPVEAEVTA